MSKKATATKQNQQAANDQEFFAGDTVVYPAHGVGKIEGVEDTNIAGHEVSLYTISFAKDRMRLKLPVHKIKKSGLRKLSSSERLDEAYETLKGKSHIKRTMWSRRAQEYETKINSGDPTLVAEVLRDLRRNALGEDHSYSERKIYQQALERFSAEVAAIKGISEDKAQKQVEKFLCDHADESQKAEAS